MSNRIIRTLEKSKIALMVLYCSFCFLVSSLLENGRLSKGEGKQYKPKFNEATGVAGSCGVFPVFPNAASGYLVFA